MKLGLSKKVAVVIGAGGGLGKAISFSLAREGVDVMLAGLHLDSVTQISRDLGEFNVRAIPIQVDCYQYASIKKMISTAIKEFGKIDILVNCAGDPKPGSLLSLSEEDWKSSLNLKVIGAIMTIKEVYPYMKKKGGGQIINIIGTHGKQPNPDVLTAAVCNAALMSFTKGFAREAAKYNILVNGINPGPIDTSRMQRIYESQSKEKGISFEKAREEFLSEIPLNRMGRPEEIGDFVAFLVSDRCAFVSGAVFDIDGGQVKSI